MKDIEDVLLYLHSFDQINMLDLEHNNKLYFVSEALRSEMNYRIIKNNFNYCEDAILDLIGLSFKITDMVVLKKPGELQEIKTLYVGVLQYENDSDTEFESLEYDEYDVLSEDSDTGGVIGFRNIKHKHNWWR